jgi:hypothetical protein
MSKPVYKTAENLKKRVRWGARTAKRLVKVTSCAAAAEVGGGEARMAGGGARDGSHSPEKY